MKKFTAGLVVFFLLFSFVAAQSGFGYKNSNLYGLSRASQPGGVTSVTGDECILVNPTTGAVSIVFNASCAGGGGGGGGNPFDQSLNTTDNVTFSGVNVTGNLDVGEFLVNSSTGASSVLTFLSKILGEAIFSFSNSAEVFTFFYGLNVPELESSGLITIDNTAPQLILTDRTLNADDFSVGGFNNDFFTVYNMDKSRSELLINPETNTFTVPGRIQSQNATSYSAHVLCYQSFGIIGHCTSAVNAAGRCTCTAN